jgi:hypothetical protein
MERLVMGNARQFPWHCLHLFVPAKRYIVGERGENNLHAQQMMCGMSGIDTQDTKIYSPTVTTNIVVKKEVIERNLQRGQNGGTVW